MLKLHSRWLPRLLLSCLAVVVIAAPAVAADPLDEKTLTTLIRFADEEDVVTTVQENGIAFEVDDAVLQRLRDINAGEAVLEAVRSAASPARPAQPAGPPITYDDVLALVKSGVPDRVILNSISNSPTLFTLGAAQERELRSEGASDQVIAALKGDRPRQPQATGATDSKIDVLAIVLDYSNSMNDETTDGKRKIEVARQRVSALLGAIPEGLGVTVVVYGHRGEPRPCQAVEVIRDLAPLTEQGRAQLIRDIQRRRAVGKTPIALALQTAGNVLATEDARCGLILISDGMETCYGDPAAEAAALADNLNVTFGRVIGFDVDNEGRDQLQATAAAMAGEYLSASSAEEFDRVIEDVQGELERAMEQPAIVRTPSLISALRVKPWRIEGFPDVEEIIVTPKGHPFDVVQRISDFDRSVPLEPGAYTLWHQAEGQSQQCQMGDVEIQERTTTTVDTARMVACILVREPDLEGLGDLESITLYRAGEFEKLQTVTAYNVPLMIAPDTPVDIELRLRGANAVALQKDVSLNGGELLVIGGEDGESDPFAGAEGRNE